MQDQVLEELNVKRLTLVTDAVRTGQLCDQAEPAGAGPAAGQAPGRRCAPPWPALDPAVMAGSGAARAGPSSCTLAGEDEPLELAPTDLLVETQQREGFAVEQDKGVVVALDTTLTDELRAEGLARDLVRLIQDMRKDAGFAISDRIHTTYTVAATAGRARLACAGPGPLRRLCQSPKRYRWTGRRPRRPPAASRPSTRWTAHGDAGGAKKHVGRGGLDHEHTKRRKTRNEKNAVSEKHAGGVDGGLSAPPVCLREIAGWVSLDARVFSSVSFRLVRRFVCSRFNTTPP